MDNSEDPIIKRLLQLADDIAAKRAPIRSWENYGKETFLAFDSYNLGLTTAYEMVGNVIAELTSFGNKPVSEYAKREQGQ